MRVAIPVRNGKIFGHFGQASTFLLATIEGDQINRTEVQVPEESGHHGLPAFLKEHGVTHVIAGGVGPGMVNRLAQAGLPLIAGIQGSPDEALSRFVAGTLEPGPNDEHHHHHGHDHHDHHHGSGGCGHCNH